MSRKWCSSQETNIILACIFTTYYQNWQYATILKTSFCDFHIFLSKTWRLMKLKLLQVNNITCTSTFTVSRDSCHGQKHKASKPLIHLAFEGMDLLFKFSWLWLDFVTFYYHGGSNISPSSSLYTEAIKQHQLGRFQLNIIRTPAPPPRPENTHWLVLFSLSMINGNWNRELCKPDTANPRTCSRVRTWTYT